MKKIVCLLLLFCLLLSGCSKEEPRYVNVYECSVKDNYGNLVTVYVEVPNPEKAYTVQVVDNATIRISDEDGYIGDAFLTDESFYTSYVVNNMSDVLWDVGMPETDNHYFFQRMGDDGLLDSTAVTRQGPSNYVLYFFYMYPVSERIGPMLEYLWIYDEYPPE